MSSGSGSWPRDRDRHSAYLQTRLSAYTASSTEVNTGTPTRAIANGSDSLSSMGVSDDAIRIASTGLVDLAAVAATLADHRGAGEERPILVVDNTFASPIAQRPLTLGADIVYHSATKYLGGHSDVVNGVLATSRGDLFERLSFLQNAIGAVPGPFDCFLVLRGLRTLALRMERHSSNALAVALALAAREDVATVRYPGLAAGRHAHPQASLAARQMAMAGGMVSFDPAATGGRSAADRARAFCEATRIFRLAESLGGVESLCEVPAVMTHGSVAGSTLEVSPALVRLSVGIEHPADLIADISQALDRA